MGSSKGKLYLIPTTLGESAPTNVLPSHNFSVIDSIGHFIVENEKNARKFLKQSGITRPIQEIQLYSLNEHTEQKELNALLVPLLAGKDMGVISEAGCPGIADPGADIVRLAHKNNIQVIPLVGPSSILLALMASGFNGQSFVFNGYLPRDRNERIKRIKEIEKISGTKKQTQIFIETPYRNGHMTEDLIQQCEPDTFLCIAADITLPTEYIASKSITEWRKNPEIVEKLYKRPAIFLLHRY